MTIVIWIPGAPRSPNRRPHTTRGRMRLVKVEREKAALCALAVRNGQRLQPILGPAAVHYELHRARLLDLANAWASIKHMEDGVVSVFLPHGDGPNSPYQFTLGQTQVARAAEGLRVTITVKNNLDKD